MNCDLIIPTFVHTIGHKCDKFFLPPQEEKKKNRKENRKENFYKKKEKIYMYVIKNGYKVDGGGRQ